jgi:hypothetical protein
MECMHLISENSHKLINSQLSIPLISALPSSPRLGYVDCEKEEVLCTAWGAALPSVWHFSFPQKPLDPSTPTPPTPLRILFVNSTATTAQDFLKMVTDKTHLEEEEYTGILHPIDGILQKLGLLMPLGYALWGFGSVPSWLIIVGVSFFSRQYMARKAGRQVPFTAQPSQAQAAAPPPAAGRAARKKKN